MTRIGLAPDAAANLVETRARPAAGIALVAPAALRTDLLADLYGRVRGGEIDRAEARARLDHMRALKVRLLGDRVLQAVAWDIAEALDHADTRLAEYIAVTRLQADALVTLDEGLARDAARFVPVVPFADLGAT